MKPTSIIFLVISLLVVLAGYFTVQAAEKAALTEGVELLAPIDEGEYRFEEELDDKELGKISINVKDATVNIYGGAEESRIELVNFADGLYEYANTGRVLTVNNNSDFSTLESLAGLVMNFKGIRSLVNFYNIRELDKTVNIYISDYSKLKIIELVMDSGDVRVEGGITMTDYNLTLGSGNAVLIDVATTSSVNASIKSGSLKLDRCTVSNFVADVGKGSIELSACDVNSFKCELDKGDLDFGYRYDFALVNLDLFCDEGEVTIDGQSVGGFFEDTEKPSTYMYEIKLGKGDITLTSNDTIPDPAAMP